MHDWNEYSAIVREKVPLAPFTTWRIGGSARWYARPSADSLPGLLALANEGGIPVCFLGRGSNVLIGDDGIDGLVVHSKQSLEGIHRISDDLVEADAGVPLPRLSRFVANLGCAGFEFLIGIPGTVGGGIVINAGLRSPFRREISDVLDAVDVLESDGTICTLAARELGLRYRGSTLLERGLFVLRARFRLEDFRSGSEVIRKRTAHHLLERRQNQPLNRRTAGSTFKQVQAGPATGWYIEKAGLKGHRVGGAMVSHKHANWIETDSDARADDVRGLMEVMVGTVQEKFGVKLEREVRFLPEDVGFHA